MLLAGIYHKGRTTRVTIKFCGLVQNLGFGRGYGVYNGFRVGGQGRERGDIKTGTLLEIEGVFFFLVGVAWFKGVIGGKRQAEGDGERGEREKVYQPYDVVLKS